MGAGWTARWHARACFHAFYFFGPKVRPVADRACVRIRVCMHKLSRFVPSKIPRKRRLQTLAVAIWSTLIAIATFAFFFLL